MGEEVLYLIIRSVNEFEKVLSEIEKADKWSVDTEGIIRVYPNWDIVGISISTDGKTGCYIPVGHADGSGQLPADYVVSKLKPFFEQPGKRLYMHNSKYDMKVFRLIDPTIKFNEENAFCTMTASFILDVNSEHGLKACVKKEFDHVMTTLEEVCPKEKDPKTGDKIFRADKSLIEEIAPYAIDDAVQTFRLGELYEERINELGIQKMFYELEIPLMFILMEMEENGIRLDTDKLNSILAEAPQTIDTLKKQITDLLPDEYKDININSLQQLNKLFFEGLKIKPRGDKLKSGIYSVKNEFLLMWSVEHKICELLLEYRKLGKLFGTYLANFNDRISPDGRLRCNFNRHVAATGRLSSSRPNLQNVPRKENDVYGMRDLFIAAPGKVFVCADYSQIELRVEAHLSRDPMFMQAFEDGIDIHSLTAKELFNLDCELDEVQKKYKAKRQIAKAINFGIIYEAGVRTLTATANKELDEKDRITEEQMQGLMDRYFRKYSSIKNYIDYCHRQAIQNGFVKTIVGRKRYLPDAQQKGDKLTKDDMRRKYGALRMSSNTPTQGSAFDIMSIAMRNIKRRNIAEGLEETTKIILQLHDEIIVETDEQYSEQVAKTVKEEMEQAVSLRVPLEAVVQVGYVWGNMK